MFKIVINNSFCNFTGNVPEIVHQQVKELLTYYNDIVFDKFRLFKSLKYNKLNIQNTQDSQTLLKLNKQRTNLFKELKDLEASKEVCWYLDGIFPTGHINLIKDLLNELKVEYEVEDQRVRPDTQYTFRWVNKPPLLRYYQKEALEIGLKEGRGVFSMAVGSGKSLLLINLIKELGVRSLIILPSCGLREQLYNEFVIYLGSQNCQIIDSDMLKLTKKFKPIRFVTIQTIQALKKSGQLEKIIQDIDLLVTEEHHHSASSTYVNLIPDTQHIYFKYGTTGSFCRNDNKTLDMWGVLSNELYEYKAKQAIADGYLTPIKLKIHEIKGKAKRFYAAEYNANYCKNRLLLSKIHEIIRGVGDSQVLILVQRKEKSGDIVHKFLKELGIDNAYLSGDDSAEVINETIQAFNDKKIRVLVGSSVIGEGINLCSTDHLIMLQGGKSKIQIIQAIGRLARLCEGKKFGTIHDFRFTHTKFLIKHLKQRLQIYKDNFGCE